MAIDRKKLQEFQQGMRELLKSVGFKEHQEIMQAKIEMLISRNPEISQANLKKAIKNIFEPEYSQYVTKVFKGYNSTLDIINGVYSDLGIDIERNFTRLKHIEVICSGYMGKFSEGAQKKLVKAVREGLSEDLTAKQLADKLQELGGDVTGYADAISETHLKGYGRIAKIEKARIASVSYFDYVGSIIQHSRDFCIDLLTKSKAGKRWTVDEINMMNNGQVGKEDVLTYAGGWRCHHDWEPDSSYEGE